MQIAAVRKIAIDYGLPQELILGITDKESAGRAFWDVGGKKLPAIRAEGHYFYRLLSGEQRKLAVKQKLAAKSHGVIKNPSDYTARYAMLQRMVKIDANAALMSISMGIGQVMGEHFARLGYERVNDMWQAARTSLEQQVDMICRFISSDTSLKAAVLRKDYEAIAYEYNGSRWKTTNPSYARELEKYTNRYALGDVPVTSVDMPLPSLRDTWLIKVKKLGFESVVVYQTENGLTPDGIAGKLTRESILAAEAAPRTAKIETVTAVVKNTGLAGGAAAAGLAAAKQAAEIANAAKPITDQVLKLGMYGAYLTGTLIVVLGATLLFLGIKKWINKDI